MTTGRVLVVDDERGAREPLERLLSDSGWEVRTAEDGVEALGTLEDWRADIVLTDLKMPVLDGLELIERIREDHPEMPCIVMTAFGSIETAVEAMQLGADDYLTKPLDVEEVEIVLDRTMERVELRREVRELRERPSDEGTETEIVGQSGAMREVVEMADQVARATSTVLITGESGTGKELVAERIHRKSDRSDGPFVRVNCAALADTLLESELFGHEEGAFTGASEQRVGRFEEADGGTLLLDEIGEVAESTQVELLRFLEEREFERVGGNETIEVDVRILAATNRDLQEAVREGSFREDLYFRLDVVNIDLPPLRNRREDIPLLANHFAARHAERNDKRVEGLSPEVVERFRAYEWPGNVRELENVVERAVVMTRDEILDVDDLPPDFGDAGFAPEVDIRIPGSTLEAIERFAILETYEATGGSTSETAEILDVSDRKIQYKLKEYREAWEDEPVAADDE